MDGKCVWLKCNGASYLASFLTLFLVVVVGRASALGEKITVYWSIGYSACTVMFAVCFRAAFTRYLIPILPLVLLIVTRVERTVNGGSWHLRNAYWLILQLTRSR